jgi:flagellin-specific chaperone FliS
MDNRVNAYWRTETLGKSQIDLLLQVYDGAITAYTAAGECYRKEEYEPGEIALNLGKLYAYILNETDGIQGTKSQEQIAAVIRMLGNLRSGWAALKKADSTDRAPSSDLTESPTVTGNFVTSG